MSEQIDRVVEGAQVTEWLNAWDERLVIVAGLQPPVDCNNIREDWHVQYDEIPRLLEIVKRILVPQELTDKVKPMFAPSNWGESGWSGTVDLEFENESDWQQVLPVSEKTLVFDRQGCRGNASIALCGKVAGLAVIAMDFYVEDGLDFAVQSVRPDKLAQIVAM